MRWFGRVVAIAAIVLLWLTLASALMPTHASAETWNHRATVSLAKNSPAKAKYVQGVAYDGTRYAYVVKQNSSRHQSLWRADMRKGGKARKLTVSAKARKAIHHGNDMEFVRAHGTSYLLVAPCKAGSRYVVVLRVKGTKVTYHKRIWCGFTSKVSAIAKVGQDGDRVRVIMGRNSKLWMVTLDLRFGTYYKNHGRVYGYESNQGIGYANGRLLACDGGYKTRRANVRCYKVAKVGNHWTLRRQWVRQVKGEAEGAFFDRSGRVCVALEGKWHWNYSDRITRWAR